MHFSRASIVFALAFIPLVALADGPGEPKNAGNDIFVAVGYGGRRMSSRDGQHWENVQQWAQKGEDDSNNLISVAYGKGKFVAVGGGGWSRETQAGHILVSTEGKDWHEVKKMQFRISPILFENGHFVAGGPARQLLSSEDGENWTETAPVALPKEIPEWAFWFRRGIAGNGIFIFTGNADVKQKTWWCITSHDGKTIESFATDLPEVRSLAFGNGTFVLASPDAIYTSSDGKKWTKAPASPADHFRDVIRAGNQFLLSGEKASYASADGVEWKAFGKSIPCDLCWSDGSLFVGTSWAGRMWFSTDGKEWKQTEHPMPEMGINQVVRGAVR